MVHSLIYSPKELAATPEVLSLVSEAAKLGLTGDNLAYAAGLTPLEFRSIQEFDPALNQAIGAARAKGEAEMALVLYEDAKNGNAKSAIEMLKHKHGWVATTAVKHEGGINLVLATGVPTAENHLSDPNDISCE